MKSGVKSKYSSAICFKVKFSGGTTEATAIALIDLKSSAARAKRFRACRPHSSTVRERAVVSRQCAESFSPSKTPSEVFVLPISMTSSIQSLLVFRTLQNAFDFVSSYQGALLLANLLRNLSGRIVVSRFVKQTLQLVDC